MFILENNRFGRYYFETALLLRNSLFLSVILHDIEVMHNIKQTILIYTMPGALIGTMMITYLASGLLIKLFSIILIIYGIINLFFPNIIIPKAIKQSLLILGGFIQGIYTVGGPFVLMGFKDTSSN